MFFLNNIVSDVEFKFPDYEKKEDSEKDFVFFDKLKKKYRFRCPNCGAYLLDGMNYICCGSKKPKVTELVKKLVPPNLPIDIQNLVLEHQKRSANFPRKLNRDLRPVIQNAKIGRISNFSSLYLQGIPYALNQAKQFSTPVYGIFTSNESITDRMLYEVPPEIIEMLYSKNKFLKNYLKNNLAHVRTIMESRITIEGSTNPTIQCAIIPPLGPQIEPEQLEVLLNSYETQNIPFHLPDYDRLIYPLIFWNGKGGFGAVDNNTSSTNLIRKGVISLVLQDDDYFLNKLYMLREEYICAQFARLQNIKVAYLQQMEKKYFIKEKEISQLINADNEVEYGKKTYVPPSLVNTDAYWHKIQQRSFQLCVALGPPTFFLTITFNPNWPEVRAFTRAPSPYFDGAIQALVFKSKLSNVMQYIKSSEQLGKVKASIYRIEYQDRGYAHAHILFWTDLDTEDLIKVESVINTQYPPNECLPTDTEAFKRSKVLIDRYQIHKHTKRCLKSDGKCSFGYPQETCDKSHYKFHKIILPRNENETMIVPHNLALSFLLRAHHCLEVISSHECIGYILKYCSKNSDKQKVQINPVRYSKDVQDQLREALASQVIPSAQCFLNIMGAWNYHIEPTVIELPIHKENDRILLISENEDPNERADSLSLLQRYFVRPNHPRFNDLTYTEYYSKYCISYQKRKDSVEDLGDKVRYITRRKSDAICYIIAKSKDLELIALRQLLIHFPARSFSDIRTVNGIEFDNYIEVCMARGLCEDNQELYRMFILEAIQARRPPSDLRFLLILLEQQEASIDSIFNDFHDCFFDYNDTEETVHCKLDAIRKRLGVIPSFQDSSMYARPRSPGDSSRSDNIFNKRKLNKSQMEVAEMIISMIKNHENKLIFLQGAAGTGKTFTVNVILNEIASECNCLICATTAIAATQYEGATTLHSLFKLGIDDRFDKFADGFISPIGKGSYKANQLSRSDVIIIDEISMLTPDVSKKVSFILSDLMQNDKPFGGKSILFVGDLLQLPPVMKDNSMNVADRLITTFDYWDDIIKFQLRQPMRSHHQKWNEFLDHLSKNEISGIKWEELRKFGCIVCWNVQESIDFFLKDLDISKDFPLDRLWICSTNKFVDEMNIFFQKLRSTKVPKIGTFYSTTKLNESIHDAKLNRIYQVDFLEKMHFPDLPLHHLDVYQGDPFIFLRNISITDGIVKGNRLYIREATQNTCVAEYTHKEQTKQIILPKIKMTKSFNGMEFTSLQLPIKLIYAGTCHKAQGLTLNKVVIDLRSHFWEHGHLYVALSRIRDPKNLCILLPNKEASLISIPELQDKYVVDVIKHIGDSSVGQDNERSKNEEMIDIHTQSFNKIIDSFEEAGEQMSMNEENEEEDNCSHIPNSLEDELETSHQFHIDIENDIIPN